MSSIKCSKCQTWNEDQDYCTQCGELLSFEIKRALERKKHEQEEQERPAAQFSAYLEHLKSSPLLGDRVKYFFMNSALWVFIAFVTVSLMFLALGPG
jgi:uncharacterized membrane protein YvbJ